eukprot:SAG31_NODE_10331_length_1153_cov_1.214421_1_plen_287_part_10
MSCPSCRPPAAAPQHARRGALSQQEARARLCEAAGARGGRAAKITKEEWEFDDVLGPVDRVISCAGWKFDRQLFSPKPLMFNRKYPRMTSTFESENVPGLFFAGTLMHQRDYLHSSGGFIHGFRYLVRALHRQFELVHHHVGWPSFNLPNSDAQHLELVRAIFRRINEMSGPYQMFGSLVDLILIDDDASTIVYFEEVPADFVSTLLEARLPTGNTVRYLTLSIEYGRGFSGPGKDVFDPAALHPPDFEAPEGPGASSNFLHPVVRLHEVIIGSRPTGRRAKKILRG